MSTLANARRWLLPLTAALAVTLFLVACGSSSSSSSTTSSSASGTSTGASASTGTRSAAFTRDFTKWSTPPSQIPVSTALPKPAPKGMSIAYITCGLPTCTTISNSVKSAAQTLGWKFTALGSQPTPEAIKAAWGQAVRLHPDAVFASGFPSSVFAPELAELHKMGVGVFNCCAPDKVGNGITFLAVTPTDETVQGHYIAALAAKFAKGTPNVLFVNLPEFATIQTQYPDFVSALEEYAPGAKQVKINIPNSAIGTTSAGTIVSYLRSHPDINYVALSQDALSAGLPAAMKAAGLNIPFSGDGGGPQPRELVATGQQAGSVEFPIDQVFYTMVDAFIRWKEGASMQPDQAALKPPPYMLITKANVNSTPTTIVPDLKQKYAQLWGVQQ
jgi:ribose transport system substrate-binding protein